MGWWERFTTPRGYNAAKGSLDRSQEITGQLAGLGQGQVNRALGYQGQFDTALGGMTPVFSGINARLNSGLQASQPSLYMPNIPKLTSYAPGTDLLGQINPTLDIAGTGQQVYNANLASGTQSIADQMSGAGDMARLDAARRGARSLPSTGYDAGTYSILRGQMEASNLANALGQRLGTESSLRGEQRGGALSVNDILRQQAQDAQDATLKGYGMQREGYLTGLDVDRAARDETANNYWQDYAAMMQQLGLFGGLGDVSSGAGLLSSAAGNYGNAGQGYTQLGQMQQNMWNPLLQLGGYYLGGGMGASKTPQFGIGGVSSPYGTF